MVDEASGRWAMLNWAKAADSGVSNVRAVVLNTNARESFLYATALAGCVFAVLGIQICRDEAQYTVHPLNWDVNINFESSTTVLKYLV